MIRIFSILIVVFLFTSCRDGQITDYARGEKAETNKSAVFSSWELNNESSVVSFVTVKNSDISEVHHFQTLIGFVDASGKVVVTIDLESIETNIDVRNGRMREHLFETATHRQASISAQLNLDELYALKIKSRTIKSLSVKLGLHGTVKEIEAEVFVTRISADRVLVESRMPILIHAQDYSLMPGIAKLQSLAKLSEITPVVPVSFSLVFNGEITP